jgi:hypothetical protein
MHSVGRFIVNLVAGKLDTEVPSNLHLICFKVLHHTNHSRVDGLKCCGLPEFMRRRR